MRLSTVSHTAGTSAAVLHGGTWRALPAPDLSALLTTTPPQRFADLAGDVLDDAVPVLPLPAPPR